MRAFAALLLLASTGWFHGSVPACPSWAHGAVGEDVAAGVHAGGHVADHGDDHGSAAPADRGVPGHAPGQGHSNVGCTLVMACGSAVLTMDLQAMPEPGSSVRFDPRYPLQTTHAALVPPQDPPPPRRHLI